MHPAASCFLLKGGPRGGDMPFGYEMLVWPIMIFPLGWIASGLPIVSDNLTGN